MPKRKVSPAEKKIARRPSSVLGASPRRCDGRNDAPSNSGTGHRCCPLLLQMPVADLAVPAPSSECYFPSRVVSSPLHQLLAEMVSTSCQQLPGRVSIPLAGVSSWQTPGCSQGGGKATGRVSQVREIKNGGKSLRSQAGSGVSPGPCPVRAMRAEGRERESHVSLRQPCCAVDPYVPTPVLVSITGREGGRGSAQRGVGGEEGGWCQAHRPWPRSGATNP